MVYEDVRARLRITGFPDDMATEALQKALEAFAGFPAEELEIDCDGMESGASAVLDAADQFHQAYQGKGRLIIRNSPASLSEALQAKGWNELEIQ